jgi:hypothetical protein
MEFALSNLKGANMKRESIIQGFLICVALIFLVSAYGCVSVGPTVRAYSGDKLQKSEVAVIKGWWFFSLFGYDGIDIYKIDGNYPKATKVEVLPGWHELAIRNYDFCFLPWGLCHGDLLALVAFNFEAGHEYKIKGPGIGSPGFKIVDVTTGAMILKLPEFSR